MTIRYLSGAYPDGYTLNPEYAGLVIESSASVGGAGVVATKHDVTVQNLAVVAASSTSYGILLRGGGTVTNGSATDTTAAISGHGGVRAFGRPATVTNFGTIEGQAQHGAGVILFQGGSVTNGSTDDTTALIAGANGVSLQDLPGAVVNFGTIQGTVAGAGVLLEAGGTVVNGSSSDTAALISAGVNARKVAATVVNFGTIDGVVLSYGGSVTNGSPSDTTALIAGDIGILTASGGPATISNDGTIETVGFIGGGTLTNGSNADSAALIEDGVNISFGGVTVSNFGTIISALFAGIGSSGGIIVNGSATDATALVAGAYGILADTASVTVTNFGTISGTGGKAVQFGDANCVLQVEAGCDFVGRVLGDAGVLDLASGVGLVSGLAEGHVAVSGSMPRTNFNEFGTLEIASGARFNLAGPGTIASGGVHTLLDDGLFTVNVDLTISGTLAGTGTLAMKAGATIEIDTAAPSSITTHFNGGPSTLALMNPSTFAATISGLGVGDTIDLLGLTATKAVVNRKDRLIVYDGNTSVASLQLTGNYTGATFNVGSDGKGGTDVTLQTPGVAAPHAFISAMAGFGGMVSSQAVLGEVRAAREPIFLASPRIAIA